jgi:hypothetical protein
MLRSLEKLYGCNGCRMLELSKLDKDATMCRVEKSFRKGGEEMDFAEWLVAKRKERGWTQNELAMKSVRLQFTLQIENAPRR